MRITFTFLLTCCLSLFLSSAGFAQATIADSTAKKDVYEYVEKMPMYKGGFEAMYKYIGSSISYSNNQPGGKMLISFVIAADGTIQEAKVEKGLSPELDSVALLAVQNMSGHWEPGIQKGKPVPVRFTLPLSFAPSEGDKTEKMPEYKGGVAAFVTFMKKNAKYPAGGTLRGTVYVSFVINEDGSLSNYEVIKGLEPVLNKEALRLAKLTEGNWLPATQNGQKVKVKYTMPVNF